MEKVKKLMSKKWMMVLSAVFCTVIWGSAYPVIKLGYLSMSINTVQDRIMFAGVRFFIAGVMVFLSIFPIKRKIPTLEKSRVFPVLLFGFVQTTLAYLFNYIGVANTTATKTSLLTSLPAFLAVLFAPLFFKDEHLNVNKIIGCVLGLIGVVAVNINSLEGGFTFLGEGLVIISMICNTAGGFIGKKASKGIVFESTAYQLLFGGFVLILIALLFGGTFSFTLNGVLITLYLSFVSAAAVLVWTYLLTIYEAGKVLVFNLLIPIFGALWSYALLNEKDILSPLFLLSTVLISVGIVLVNMKSGKLKNKS